MSRTLAILVLPAALAACGGGDDDAVLVFTAASLTEAFTEMGEAFEAREGVRVDLNVAGSSALREQVLEGAPADVFASADEANMAALVGDGAVEGAPARFASNRMAIGVPEGNPADVSGLDDLADGDLLVGLCAAGVPCGEAGRAVLAAAGVDAAVDTEEPNVRSLAAKLADGELDAGLVYLTDVAAIDALTGLPIDDDVNVTTGYSIAVLADAPDPKGAAAFVGFVRSPAGQEILARHGFGAP